LRLPLGEGQHQQFQAELLRSAGLGLIEAAGFRKNAKRRRSPARWRRNFWLPKGRRRLGVCQKTTQTRKESTMNVRPLHDRIVIKRIEEKETIKGGIIIPDTAKEKPQEGEVMAVGKGKREKGELIPLDVKVGDRILFGKYSGTEIKLEDQEYLIIREDEVLGVIEGTAKAAGGGKK
jgi:chaperonin GroES